MIVFFYYFFIFLIYAVIGWIVESTNISLRMGKFIDRGFLIGPYCPIYGFGCLGMILYLNQYKENVITVFILGVVICSILEYFTSYIMELLFKTRWWDYSERRFNLNGRICGENACMFGLGGLVVIYLVHPMLLGILNSLKTNTLIIISISLFIIFIIDIIISLNVINRFKKTITSIDLKKDSTLEFSKMVKQTIKENHQIFQNRLLTAFPNVSFQKIIDLKNDLKEDLMDLLKK